MARASRPAGASRRRTQAERTARSDARMLDAAVALIGARGTAGTTLKEVGEQAGYSRGLAGYRFGSKEGLFRFVVRAVGESWLQELTAVTRGKVGLAAISAALDAHRRFLSEAPEHVRAFYVLWFEAVGPGSGARAVIERVHERRRRDVLAWIGGGVDAGEIDPGVDAEALADHFCGAIVGIVYQWLVQPEPRERIDAMHETLKQTMRAQLPAPRPIPEEIAS
ncbi:MAG: TetR/AcrR family transcriptional regulator [Gammaproteobacteria bacterium]|nr:TetR/AcrR family transcriptional regulator [Gammaproteobacteria bacterium]